MEGNKLASIRILTVPPNRRLSQRAMGRRRYVRVLEAAAATGAAEELVREADVAAHGAHGAGHQDRSGGRPAEVKERRPTRLWLASSLGAGNSGVAGRNRCGLCRKEEGLPGFKYWEAIGEDEIVIVAAEPWG